MIFRCSKIMDTMSNAIVNDVIEFMGNMYVFKYVIQIPKISCPKQDDICFVPFYGIQNIA